MSVAALVLWGLVGVFGALAWSRAGDLHVRGCKIAYRHFIQIFPRVVLALMTAGFLSQIVPQELVAGWLGAGSGFRGILIASLVGGVVPGGPVVSFPIAVILLKSGAGTPQLVAFLTAWSVFALHRVLAYELPLVGWRFSLVRFVSSLPLPLVTGFLAGLIVASTPG